MIGDYKSFDCLIGMDEAIYLKICSVLQVAGDPNAIQNFKLAELTVPKDVMDLVHGDSPDTPPVRRSRRAVALRIIYQYPESRLLCATRPPVSCLVPSTYTEIRTAS